MEMKAGAIKKIKSNNFVSENNLIGKKQKKIIYCTLEKCV